MVESIISGLGGWREIAAKCAWVIQLGLIIHAYKTGRSYWWCWILLAVPVIGGLAYIIVEILPEAQAGGRYSLVNSLKPRSWIIKELREALAESDTVERRITLADELLLAHKPQEAHDVAVECLEGVFHNDPLLLMQIARFKVEAGRGEEALVLLEKVTAKMDKRMQQQIILLRGRSYELMGKHQAAIDTLHPIAGSYLGEEPHYYLGICLAATGSVEEAGAIWREIRTKFRKANTLWKRSERPWYKLAGDRLKEKVS